MTRGAGRRRGRRVRRALVLLVAAAGAASAGAQPVEVAPAVVCVLRVDSPAALPPMSVRPGEHAARLACDGPLAPFVVDYTGFPVDAQAAFQAAVDAWACRIASAVPIRVAARWAPLPASTLGSAGPFLVRNFDRAPVTDTWYPAALANDLAGRDLDAGRPEIDATFNSQSVRWHTDPAAPPPADAYDLYTVVLHELGHGLGLIGGLTVRDGRGYVGDPDATRGPYVYDRFTEDASGRLLLEAPYGDGSDLLADALRSQVRFDGAALRQVGGAVPLYAPPTWSDGGSYSHLDEAAFAAGTPDGLMTPFVGRGESIDAPGATACAMLADLGWTLAGPCDAAVGPRDSLPDDGLSATLVGPNPFAVETQVRVAVAVPQRVRVWLVDALGRTVATVADRSMGADTPLTVRVDGRRLAAGAYRVVVQGAGGTRVVGLAVVR